MIVKGAIKDQKRAMAINRHFDNTLIKTKDHDLQGQLYQHLKDYKAALPHYLLAGSLYEAAPLKNFRDVAKTYNNTAINYLYLKEFKMALACFEKSRKYQWDIFIRYDPIWVTTMTGSIEAYDSLKMYKEAISALESLVYTYKKYRMENSSGYQTAVEHLVDVYFRKATGEYDVAAYSNAISDLKIIGHYKNLNRADYYLGLCYYQLKDYNLAITFFKKVKANDHTNEIRSLNSDLGLALVQNKELSEGAAEFKIFEKKN